MQFYAVSYEISFLPQKLSLALLSYMAMAKSSVSSNIGEAAEIISDYDNGFSTKTKEEFIEKMQMLIENSDIRRSMGEKSRLSIEECYSLKVLGKRLNEILKTI